MESNNFFNILDFLCIGLLCHDQHKEGFILGGTASYASLMASQLGNNTAVLTSVGNDFSFFDLFKNNNIHVLNKPIKKTTVFNNIYESGVRSQFIYHPPEKLLINDLPENWKGSPVVMLCPIANEVDFYLLNAFPNSLVGATIQGWLRQWDDKGKVSPKKINWALLKPIDIVFMSDVDIMGYENELPKIIKQAKIVVVTKGANGAAVFHENKKYEFPSFPAKEVDSTGAGDIFATAFLIQYNKTKNIALSAAYAHAAASYIIENIGIKLPTINSIQLRYRQYLNVFDSTITENSLY